MKNLTVSSIDGVPLKVSIVPKGNVAIRPAYFMSPKSIAIHNTGNAGKGADAEAHNRLLKNEVKNPNARYASYHFVVDEHRIIQNLPLDESAWHTGDGVGIHSGNRTAIGIEICENSDGNYKKAEANAVKLVAYLMKLFGFGINLIKPHQAYSGKYCPHIILDRKGGFSTFTSAVSTYRATGTVSVVQATKPKPSPNVKDVDIVNDAYVGRRVESIYGGKDGLNFYSKPSFDKKNLVGTLTKGMGFPVVLDKFKVSGAEMYQVKNSKGAIFYVTADSHYVKLEGKATAVKTTSKPKPKVVAGIKVVGHIQIVNVTNSAYICVTPSSSSKTVGTVKKGAKLPIAGSVPGWYEVIVDGKRRYVNQKYGKQV